MKLKKILITLALTVIALCFSACSNPAVTDLNTENVNKSGNENPGNPLYPFEGSCWCGELYTGYCDDNGENITDGVDKILEFEGKSFSMKDKTFGKVKILKDLYFFWPEGYNSKAYSKPKYTVLLGNQELNYYVVKTSEGYKAYLGLLDSDWIIVSIASSSSTSATVKNNTHGWLSYGEEPNKFTWYDDDLLPRTLTKQ